MFFLAPRVCVAKGGSTKLTIAFEKHFLCRQMCPLGVGVSCWQVIFVSSLLLEIWPSIAQILEMSSSSKEEHSIGYLTSMCSLNLSHKNTIYFVAVQIHI